MATAVPSSSTPSARWTAGPWPARRIRSTSARPPKAISSRTSAEPAPYASATTTSSPDAPWVADSEITAARMGPAQGA